MSESASKTKTPSWQPTTAQGYSDSHFTPRPFPLPVNNAAQVQASRDLVGYRKPQSGDIIDNVRRYQQTGTSSPPTEPTAITGNFLIAPTPPTFGLSIQPKLTIGEPGDRYEQEADKVANEVVQRINAPASLQRRELIAPPIPTLSSQLAAMGELKPWQRVQRQDGLVEGEATRELESSINLARGGGQPLDAGLQQSMGQAMGADFGGVRVHTDAQSDRLNQTLQAKAFTTGQDVFFRQGEYNPGSRGGQELIAHELTHVVQQSGGAVQRSQSQATVQGNQTTASFIQKVQDEQSKKFLNDYPLAAKMVKGIAKKDNNDHLAVLMRRFMESDFVYDMTPTTPDDFLKGTKKNGDCSTLARAYVKIAQEYFGHEDVKVCSKIGDFFVPEGGKVLDANGATGNVDNGQHWVFTSHYWVNTPIGTIDLLFLGQEVDQNKWVDKTEDGKLSDELEYRKFGSNTVYVANYMASTLAEKYSTNKEIALEGRQQAEDAIANLSRGGC